MAPAAAAPQGGATCSAGIGRSPSAAELNTDLARLVAGTDPTEIQIGILASSEYFQDAGGTDLDFVNRLYDDVLRHDPTPVELATGLTILNDTGASGRGELAQDVVLSGEARAIRVDQVFHTLLGSYPNSTELAVWVNRLPGASAPTSSVSQMVEAITGSSTYYALVGGKGPAFVNRLYEELLNRAPTPTELSGDAALINEITAGVASARISVAAKVLVTAEFRPARSRRSSPTTCTQRVRSFVPRSAPPRSARRRPQSSPRPSLGLASNTTEEQIIAGVLGSDQYYENHGSTETGLVEGRLPGPARAAADAAELTAALDKYPNDSSVNRVRPVDGGVRSVQGPRHLARLPAAGAPRATRLRGGTGEGVLNGDVPTLQTPDRALIARSSPHPSTTPIRGHDEPLRHSHDRGAAHATARRSVDTLSISENRLRTPRGLAGRGADSVLGGNEYGPTSSEVSTRSSSVHGLLNGPRSGDHHQVRSGFLKADPRRLVRARHHGRRVLIMGRRRLLLRARAPTVLALYPKEFPRHNT